MLVSTPLFRATHPIPSTSNPVGIHCLGLGFILSVLFVSSEGRHLLDTENWAVKLFLELELNTGLQAKKRNQKGRQVLEELSLTEDCGGRTRGYGGVFVWRYLHRNTCNQNLMSQGKGAEDCLESFYVLLSMFVGERVGHGARALHLWTVSMLTGPE